MNIEEYCTFRVFDKTYISIMKQLTIFRNLFFLACIVFSMSGCGHSRQQNISASSEIDSIASQFVPDNRMGICNIHLRNDNGNAQILTGETTSPGAKDAIIKTLGNHLNNLTDSIIILPDSSVNKKYMGLATLSVINIRSILSTALNWFHRHCLELLSGFLNPRITGISFRLLIITWAGSKNHRWFLWI